MSKQPLVGFILVLVAAAPCHASDWRHCTQTADFALGIQGCTKIIAEGRETAANLAIAYIDRGSAYYNTERYDLSVADYYKAIKIDPNKSEPYTGLGNAYYRQGDYDRAVTNYGKAIQLRPDEADNYTGRGLVYFSKGDHDRAVADFRAAANMIPPDDPRREAAFQRLALVERNIAELEAKPEPSARSRRSETMGAIATNVEESVVALVGLRDGFAE